MRAFLASPKGKLTLAALVFVIAGALLIYNFGRGGALPSGIQFVCVATGQTFRVDRTEINAVPFKNPKTGEYTLLPCKSENGVTKIDPHYRQALVALGEKNRYVDNDTLVVRSAP